MEKSLLIVTEAFELGGVETYIRDEVKALQQQGWKVHLATGRRFVDNLVPQGLQSLTSGLALGPEASIEEFLAVVDQLVELVRSEGIAAIHAHPFTALIPAMACASTAGVPCAVTLHGPSSVAGSYGPAYDFMLASLVLPASSAVIAVSEEVAGLASPYVACGNLSVQRNPMVLPALAEGAGNGRWLAVSRLDEAKVDGLAEFARSAVEAGIAGLDVCGDGPARARLEACLADLIDGGVVRLLGASDDVAQLMAGYSGVAGMGRVALEGLVAGLPVVLVGYDGAKGLLDEALYRQAVRANLSGRGLPNVAGTELAAQLRLSGPSSTRAMAALARAEHGAEALWSQFADRLLGLPPVTSDIVDAYLRQMRAAHPHSSASAYWSREVMDVMARVLASPLATGTHLAQAFSIYAELFTRSVVEQQADATRQALPAASSGPDPVALAAAAAEEAQARAALQEWMARVEHRLSALDGDAREHADHLRATVEREVRRTTESLRPDVQALAEQIHDLASRIATDHRQESARLRDALQASSNHFIDALLERSTAGNDALRSQLRHASEEMRGELRGEFERLRAAAKHESEGHGQRFRQEMETFRDTIRHQTMASAGEFRRETRLAFSEATRGIELKMERALAVTESGIRQELRSVAGGLDAHAEMNKDIVELHQRVIDLESELVGVYQSSSWVLTRPLRVFKRLVLEPRATWRLIRAGSQPAPTAPGESAPKRSGRMRRAWNFIRRSVRTGRIDPADKARLIGMIRSRYEVVAQNLGVEIERPVLAAAQLDDVFVWSVIDWHFRMQRPQHLAAAMAGKGHRVFYISNNFVDSATPGFGVEALDAEGRLFQVNLHVAGAPQIYFDVASPAQVAAIQASLATLLKWTATTKSISLVQHPFWLEPAQSLPNMRLVYDCMDHHGGFEDNSASVIAGERALVEQSDLLIVTSQWLQDEMEGKSSNIAMIRNATEYDHFCTRPAEVFSDAEGRRIIGYYGAIAEWFDVELVRRTALDHPSDLVVLVGRDTAGAQEQLSDVANVRFIGEVPYKELPYWVHAFDVCLLPFKVIPLTLATNPVKVYEYLSAGRPTVSVDLPEMVQFEGLVALATEPAQFSQAVTRALDPSSMAPAHVEARQAFARQQTWSHRAAALDTALDGIVEPKVSVVVLCYNNLEFTQACLHSLELYSDYPQMEVIAVDNASSDGTADYLREWEAAGSNRRFIGNASNLGFSAGNNVGLAAATGDYLVILNNDTYVTPGWVRGMVRHLQRNPGTGLVGPVTNNIGNEARIEIHYQTMEEMIERAGEYTRRHAGQSFEMATAAFFCVMMTRRAYEAVGPMDENFGVGFFEDDDYCRRLLQEGFVVRCAEDVFVHHHLSASFNKLKAEAKQALFDANKKIYEAKWGPWVPHTYRERSTHS